MDVLEAMRRRRMHRYFDPAPLDDETLQTFAWAATRAPAGGNQPSRYVLVVKQPSLVKTLVEVTPSYIGTQPPAVILILTDVDGAERQMGAQGRDHLSRLDAGAAAEHVALAAVGLGLGCYLFRCSNEAALRVVFDLPPSVRIDWLAAVGRPAATPSPAPKAPPQVVYVDRWGGEQWEVRRR
ncbi:MAG: nitroreductase family protein [Acidimicrobiales bacterium]|jgi:nitroreductase